MYKPGDREAALILLYAIEQRGKRRGKEMTRVRLSRLTLKRLWNREQIDPEWLNSVNEWLLSAGWVLIYAGTAFAAVKVSIIDNWPRLASKHVETLTEQVKQGSYDFSELAYLFGSASGAAGNQSTLENPSHLPVSEKPIRQMARNRRQS